MEHTNQSYSPDLENITDEEEDDIVEVEVVSCFPNGECARTSPGNHSTVRRWRQRSSRKVETYERKNSTKYGFSPLSVETHPALDLSGPSSAPSTFHWEAVKKESTPAASSRPKVAFDISSIVKDSKTPVKTRPKIIFEEVPKSTIGTGHSIPVGIAVGRQRSTQPATQVPHSSSQISLPASLPPTTMPNIDIHQPSNHLNIPSSVLTLPPPPLSQNLYPNMLIPPPPTPSHWSHIQQNQIGYNYHMPFHPDPSYYLYLQQQLLLLHHHHVQLSRHIAPQGTYAEHFQRQNNNFHSDSREDQHLNESGEPSNTNFKGFHEDGRNKKQHVEKVTPGFMETKQSVPKEVNDKNTSNSSIGKDDLNKEISIESDSIDNHLVTNSITISEDTIEDDISVGDEREPETVISSDNESVKTANEDECCADNDSFVKHQDNVEKAQVSNGLYLLAESIVCIEKNEDELKRIRKGRYASTDCCDTQNDALNILCDVANLQTKVKDLSSRVERSKSLDSQPVKIDRISTTDEAKNDIKEFIDIQRNKYKQKDESDEDMGDNPKNNKQNKDDDMDAWEINLRIQMAEKQKKYTEINRKLKKIEKHKNKLPENLKKNTKHFAPVFEETLQSKSDDKSLQKLANEVDITCDSTKSITEKENGHIQSSIVDSFQTSKKSYLAPQNIQDSHTKHEENKSFEKCLEHEFIKKQNVEDYQNNKIKQQTEATIKSDANSTIIPKSIVIKKPKQEKFLLAENIIKKETTSVEEIKQFDDDLFEYKHKKIRRNNNDCEIAKSLLENSTEDYITDNSLQTGFDRDKQENKSYPEISSKHMKKNAKNKRKNSKKESRDMLINFKEQYVLSELSYETKSKDKKKKKKKDKKRRKEKMRIDMQSSLKTSTISENECSYENENHSSCSLRATDLVDGLRILKRIGDHFCPGRLTDISPPDIYGIVVDKERGNKPHIFSQEEVLQEAVMEVKPTSVSELKVGDRVCAFWSSKMSYLHPGAVAGFDGDEDFAIIQLDDGDSRDIHIDQIRYLPQNYPLIVPEQDSFTGLFGSRKRVSSTVTHTSAEKKRKTSKDHASTKKQTKHKTKKKKYKECEWSVSVTEVSDKCQDSTEALDDCTLDNSSPVDCDQTSLSNGHRKELDVDQDMESSSDRKKSLSKKSPIAAFLPPQHLLWSWSDEGRKLSVKARKVYHDSIEKDDETIQVGDCAVFLSTYRPDRPYIGCIESMWETSTGNMKVQVKWFYHPAEVEGTAVGGGRVEDIKTKGALFSSSHYDENDVQTISHKCQVVQFEQFREMNKTNDNDSDMDNDDTYYLAGEYDPVEGTIVFMQGIF